MVWNYKVKQILLKATLAILIIQKIKIIDSKIFFSKIDYENETALEN